MSKVTLITEKTKITAAVKSLSTRTARWQKDAHVAALSVVQHSITHGDTTVLVSLINAFPKSNSRDKLRSWVTTFAPCLKVNLGAKPTVKFADGITRTFDVTAAMETPYWEMESANNAAEVTVNTVVERFAKALAKLEKEGDLSVGVADKMVAAVKALVPVTDAQVVQELAKAS